MKVIYHLGVHCTDDDKIVTCLHANAALLAKEGIVVPAPEVYRPILRDTLTATRGSGVTRETQETLLDAVMDQDHAERLVFSNQSFICMRQRVLGDGRFYPMAAEKCQWMAGLFPDHRVEFHLAIRNPATFVPALFQREREATYETFTAGINPMLLRWSDLVSRIRAANPDCPITVWCNEDTPLIWPEVLRAVSGHEPQTRLKGVMEFLAPLMSADGMTRLTSYLESHPPQTEMQRHRIVAAFLDKFALADEMEVELDLPGWDEEYVEGLTQRYEEDVFTLSRLDGVTLIAP